MNYTMPKHPQKPTMTDLLRAALKRARPTSLLGVQNATGLKRQSLMKFRDGEQSLRLDLADKLAAHFGIESRATRRPRGS